VDLEGHPLITTPPLEEHDPEQHFLQGEPERRQNKETGRELLERGQLETPE